VTVQDVLSTSGAEFARPRSFYAPAKRALDLLIAVPALIFVAPLFAAIALLIKLDSKGPVYFRQKRIGLGGRAFDIFKFRSMRVLENGDTVIQATKKDPRVTRIGRFLRASSLDELPQLLNIVTGEMSLVGPRPHACAHDRHFADLISNYARRHDVKPGLTGWAQVNGHRGETPTLALMRTRVEHDAWYARHASLALDLKILARTPFEVARSRNAH
jgi:exopolysaccharide biosynthesis polyprenyl glycosylphosphotransferase